MTFQDKSALAFDRPFQELARYSPGSPSPAMQTLILEVPIH